MIDLLLLLALFSGATWVLGWTGVLLVTVAWAWWWGWDRPAWKPAIAAALVWVGLLLVAGPPEALTELLQRLEGTVGLSGSFLVALVPGFAAALAWSAARMMQGIGLSRSK